MSFEIPNDDDENNKNGEGTDTGGDNGGGGGGVIGGGEGGGQSQAQTASAKPTSSGSWTNLQSYLDANADQAKGIGDQISSTINNQAQTAQGETQAASDDFLNSVNQGKVSEDDGQVNQALGDAKTGALSPEELAAFQKQYNASYGGPTDFTKSAGFDKASQDLTGASQAVDQTKSEAGRDVLLGNQYQNTSQNGYNRGEKSLDQMLLENNPDNQATFSNVQNQWSGLNGLLSGATTSANQAAADAKAATDAASQKAHGALDTANSEFQTAQNQKLTAAQQAYQDQLNQATNDLQSGKLTQEEADAFGLKNGQQTYGLALKDYLTPGENPTLANISSSNDYAQAAALAQLAGQDSSTYLPGSEASQAGTYKSPYSFNSDKFNSDVGSAQAAWQQNYNNAWNTAQAVPALGGQPVSMNQLQQFVDMVASSQSQLGRNDPSQWGGSDGATARAYKQVIDQWKAAHAYGSGTVTVNNSIAPPPKGTQAV